MWKKKGNNSMSCCNDKRARAVTTTAVAARTTQQEQLYLRHRPNAASVAFEYVGETSLTVSGPVTGARYRFPAPGSRLDVDARDAAYVGAVPSLRRAL